MPQRQWGRRCQRPHRNRLAALHTGVALAPILRPFHPSRDFAGSLGRRPLLATSALAIMRGGLPRRERAGCAWCWLGSRSGAHWLHSGWLGGHRRGRSHWSGGLGSHRLSSNSWSSSSRLRQSRTAAGQILRPSLARRQRLGGLGGLIAFATDLHRIVSGKSRRSGETTSHHGKRKRGFQNLVQFNIPSTMTIEDWPPKTG